MPPPARGRAAPAAQRAQGLGLRAHSGPSAWALPMGPPGLAPSPPLAARARWHRAAVYPPLPPCAALGSARRACTVAGCGPPCATGGGLEGGSPVLPPPVPRVGQPGGGSPGPGGPVRPRQARQPSPHRPPPSCCAAGRGAPLAALATARAPQFPGPGGPGYRVRPRAAGAGKLRGLSPRTHQRFASSFLGLRPAD